MSNYAKLYWLTRLDYIQNFFVLICVLALIYIIITLIYCNVTADFDQYRKTDEQIMRKAIRKTALNRIKWILPLAILAMLISCLIPAKNEAIFIVAGGMTLDYAQKDTSLQKLPYQATKIVSAYMGKKIEEITGNLVNENLPKLSPDSILNTAKEVDTTITKLP